nr:helix-turn-helix transcriptional regulator [Modestobacter muralis]
MTPRQREVLALLAEGVSTPEIARRMAVSVNTVRTHVNVLLHRLGVHSRLRAVALYADAAGAGWPPPHDHGA